MKSYFTYILLCSDDSFYIGVTSDLERRMLEHSSGYNKSGYTYSRRPVKLLHFEEFQNPKDAIAREKQIKKWSRAKKQALANSDYESIINLSKKVFGENK